jgi:predicted TIM-barrel fold metal-dependent hydrolase
MHGKIAVEEHFALAETAGYAARHGGSGYWSELGNLLLEFHDRRLAAMDRSGIEMAVLSLNAPAVQQTMAVGFAIDLARRTNDFLAEQVARRPDRFAGLAALPLQDPDAAALELQRCVRDLGFKGTLVNGYSQTPNAMLYYDLPQYRSFWAEVERLDVPFYLHPRDGMVGRNQPYEGHAWLVGSPWSFGEETALHALRLMGCGLFDQHPKLQIVLGHLGERIPYDLWRLDHRLSKIPDRPAEREMAHYFRSSFHVTTSGNFSTPTLIQAISTVGVDRVLFAVDYPFEENEQASDWLDGAGLSELDQLKIGRLNALSLFKLDCRALDDRPIEEPSSQSRC